MGCTRSVRKVTALPHEHSWELAHGNFLRDHRSLHDGTGRYLAQVACECGAKSVIVHAPRAEPIEFEGKTFADTAEIVNSLR